MKLGSGILKPKYNPTLTMAEITNIIKRVFGEKRREKTFFTFRLHIVFYNFTRLSANANKSGEFLYQPQPCKLPLPKKPA
jgi:hypothetical protein